MHLMVPTAQQFIDEVAGGERHREEPTPMQVAAASELFAQLRSAAGWAFAQRPRLHLGSDVLVPDLAAWRVGRLPEKCEGTITRAPDWVCEVLSEDSESFDRAVKFPRYAAHGVAHACLCNVDLQFIELRSLHRDGWLMEAVVLGDRSLQVALFGLELDLAALWARVGAN
jgi:Uma2 family endonuclease